MLRTREEIIAALLVVLTVVIFLALAPQFFSKKSAITLNTFKPSVSAYDQKPGNKVVVATAIFSYTGYVAIYSEINGEPGAVIGVSELIDHGTNNILVEFSPSSVIREGDMLYAVLHMDNGDGNYEYPGPDEPIKNDSGNFVMAKFKIVEQ